MHEILNWAKILDLKVSGLEPGHGPGHFVRDYVNSLRLFKALEADPRHVFIGFCDAALHDIGCAFVPRYQETETVLRTLKLVDWFCNIYLPIPTVD